MVSFPGKIKSAISGVLVAAGCVVAAQPVTLVAVAALPWIAHRLSRCCSGRQKPEIRQEPRSFSWTRTLKVGLGIIGLIYGNAILRNNNSTKPMDMEPVGIKSELTRFLERMADMDSPPLFMATVEARKIAQRLGVINIDQLLV